MQPPTDAENAVPYAPLPPSAPSRTPLTAHPLSSASPFRAATPTPRKPPATPATLRAATPGRLGSARRVLQPPQAPPASTESDLLVSSTVTLVPVRTPRRRDTPAGCPSLPLWAAVLSRAVRTA